MRACLILAVFACLLGGVAGGLLRAGTLPAWLIDGPWIGYAALDHAALMLSSLLGSVIGVERAVALRQHWAFLVPGTAASAGVLLLTGHAQAGAWLGLMASCVFVGVNFIFWLRQPYTHIALLLTGALAWAVGSAMFVIDGVSVRALPWWFAFIVLTIAAERLEMHRVLRRNTWALPLLLAAVASLLVGAALSSAKPDGGGVLYGLALVSLALWFAVFDIARRTVRATGLSRYMALCLLGGYAWLAVAGLAWAGMALGCPGRDMALHALGLGFIIGMVMGHAPVILPAVTGIKLLFGNWFYMPLALLHASLCVRLFGGMVDPALRAQGSLLNALALGCFALTVAGSAVALRRRKKLVTRLAECN
jgi:hypothetical protein